MTPRTTPLLCLLAAAGEVALILSVAGGGRLTVIDAAFLFFQAGPLVFLALLAWRRRADPAASRRLWRVAVALAAFGLAVLGVVALWFHLDPAAGGPAGFAPLAVPVVQWLAVLAAWLGIARREARNRLGERGA